jgi:hypothetical protein
MEDKLDMILEQLGRQNDALETIDGRLRTLEANVELVREAQLAVTKRMNDLDQRICEQDSSTTSVLLQLQGRVSALEGKLTPIPRPVDGGR